MGEPVTSYLVDHLVVYGLQYILVVFFFWSEVAYVKQNVSPETSRRSACGMLSVCLVLLTLVAVTLAAYRLVVDSVAIWGDGMEAITMAAVLLLQICSTRRNVDHVYLFTFWTLRLLALSIDYAFDRVDGYVLVHFILAIVWLVVCGIRSHRTNTLQSSATHPRKPNVLRNLYFSWLDHTYREAHRGSETFHDGKLFGTLQDDRRCETLLELYEKANAIRAGYTPVDDGSGQSVQEIHRFTIRRLLAPFRGDIILTGLNRFALIVLFFLCPYLLRLLLEENQSRMYQKWIVTVLFDASIMIALLNTQYQHATQDIGLRIKSILMGAIYRSILAQASTTNASSATLTTDTVVFVPFVQDIHMMWSGPLIIIVTFVALLGWVIGLSAIVGFTIMVVVIYITRLLAQWISRQEENIKHSKNNRVRLTTNSIEQIQQIKSDLLEEFFEQHIGEQRKEELRHMRTFVWYDAVKHMLSIVTPMIVACGSFLCMYFQGSGDLLTVQSMFVAIALFNVTRFPMTVIPNLFTNWKIAKEKLDGINALVCDGRKDEPTVRMPTSILTNGTHKGSLEKMQDVVHACLDQLEDTITEDSLKAVIMKLERAQYSIANKVILRDINVKLRAGTFTGVSGTHGSGKTTLLRAFIGTVPRTAGTSTNTWNRVSYCPQTPWIHSGTIRDNILFGQEYDQARYEEVIRACCLEEDLKSFPDLDERVVSEGGHSLSGGQARRISLARAVYRHADVYLFDDPLRSLDPNVSRKVFDNVFHRTNGLLAGSTCVFISHDKEHLAIADTVLVMVDGTIGKVITPAEMTDQIVEHIAQEEQVENVQERVAKTDLKRNTKRSRKIQGKPIENTRGNVSLDLYLNFARLLKPNYYVVVVLLEGVTIGLDIFITTMLAEWAASDKRANGSLLSTSWIVLIWSCAVFFKTVLLHWGGLRLSKFVHSRMLSTILRQPMEFFDRNDSGIIVNRFSNDLNIVDTKIITNLRTVLSASFSVLGTLLLFVCKLYNELLLFAVSLTAAVFLVLGLRLLLSYHLKVARALKRFEASSRSPIILQYNETMQGIDTIKAYDAEERFLRLFFERIDTHQNYIYHNNSARRWIGVRLEFIGAIVIYYVALLTVSNQSMVGLTFVGIIVSYVLRLIPSLNSLLLATGALEENIISFERVAQYLDLPRETNDETGVDFPVSEEEKLPVRGPIEYRDVSLTHSDGSTVLHNVTLTIAAGEKLGIVGRTGSGKSSFIGTLFQFYPKQTSGSILIADVALKDISLKKLRGELTLVPQSTSLFSGLVQNFIDPWNTHTIELLNNSLRECELGNVTLGATLQELSVGQRQLLCLVRGLLRKKPIIILDEATSALDESTEDLILKVLHERFHDRTVLMIAHHLNTVRSCDRILWLQEGRIRKIAPLKDYTVEERIELGFRD